MAASLSNASTSEQISITGQSPQQTLHLCEDNTGPTYEAAFSPKQGATRLVIATVAGAKKYLYAAAYSFTSQSIADSLIRAKEQGIDVRVILDKKQSKDPNCKLDFLKSHGVLVRISNKKTMHNKYIIVDGDSLQLGSFNYSNNAENKNAENVLVIHSAPELVGLYLNDWKKLWDTAS